MKALELCKEALRILRRDKGDEYRYNVGILLKEAIEELEKLENKSCDGCKYDEKDDSYPSICWECSRYYADKFEKIKSYCEEQKDTWESQANGDHKVYEKILKELNK